jgi:hypothetical protein
MKKQESFSLIFGGERKGGGERVSLVKSTKANPQGRDMIGSNLDGSPTPHQSF